MTASARVVVISDRSSRGEREDRTGPLLLTELARWGFQEGSADVVIVPDEEEEIVRELESAVEAGIGLVLTTGGTGVSPRDVTPEATRRVVAKELPGFGELMRRLSQDVTPHACISRALAGTKAATLIVNLPGSPRGAVECLRMIATPARHVLDVLRGETMDCAPPEEEG